MCRQYRHLYLARYQWTQRGIFSMQLVECTAQRRGDMETESWHLSTLTLSPLSLSLVTGTSDKADIPPRPCRTFILSPSDTKIQTR